MCDLKPCRLNKTFKFSHHVTPRQRVQRNSWNDVVGKDCFSRLLRNRQLYFVPRGKLNIVFALGLEKGIFTATWEVSCRHEARATPVCSVVGSYFLQYGVATSCCTTMFHSFTGGGTARGAQHSINSWYVLGLIGPTFMVQRRCKKVPSHYQLTRTSLHIFFTVRI
jgi:hypothetical protein